MKKLVLSAMLLGSMLLGKAQQIITLTGEITSNTTLTSNNQYVLDGWVYVREGNTITIEPGTIIKGKPNTKASLIIERGAKIMAQGTATSPIVFTSGQTDKNSGDWGGIIICGKAAVNTTAGEAQVEGGVTSFYGGKTAPDNADNSGVLSYVRIEYAGSVYETGKEINALTLGAVGSGTQIDHIFIYDAFDDGIEWFGGTVNAKYLVTYGTLDDDFDMDQSFSGKLQYGVVIRKPQVADVASYSHAFETDSYKSGTTVSGLTDNSQATKAVVSNFTVIGPMATPTDVAGLADDFSPYYTSGIDLRRGSSVSFFNSVITGFPVGIVVNSRDNVGRTVSNIQDGSLEVKNVVIAGSPVKKDIVYLINGAEDKTNTSANSDTTTAAIAPPFNPTVAVKPFDPSAGPFSWLFASANSNESFASIDDIKLVNPLDETLPDVLPEANSPLLNGAAYTSAKVDNAFFIKETFIGAFGNTGKESDNWMLDWVELNPDARTYPLGDKTRSKTLVATSIFNPTPVSNMIASVAPNPTAGSMKINYNMINGSDVTIAIYDLSGNKVADVYNGFSTIGENSVNFEGSTLVKGLYLVKISTNETVKTIKVAVK